MRNLLSISRTMIMILQTTVYLLCVRSQTCTQVWFPIRKLINHRIEAVQRYFTRRLEGLPYLSNNDKLDRLNLERL